jgi:hypothetical protein
MELFLSWLSNYPLVILVIIILLLVVVFILGWVVVKQGRGIAFGPLKIDAQPPSSIEGPSHLSGHNLTIYENSDDPKFSMLFECLFQQAEKIILIGTGFSILHRQALKHMLVERIQKNLPTEIYAANPFSPNVEARLIEEETGDDTPEIRKKGLMDWLKILLAAREDLSGQSKFVLRLFPFYPTYALFIFNGKDYFFYPYGYTKLGTLSPVMHFSKDNPAHQVMIRFLDAQTERVEGRSSEADLIFNLHEDKKVDPGLLTAFAVYLIPPADSQLYQFGSEILEYDIREKKESQRAKWHNAIGAAFDFGMHVTVADALYCASMSDVNLICKEVEYLAAGFRPFTLNLSLEKDFPNERGIALVCQDKSGSLEAMHHEMVARVYRFAAASNYTLGLAQPDRDPDRERAKLMIKRYHAPYVLQRYKPHFSLLSDVPPEKKDQIYAEIKKLYEKRVEEPYIEIDRVAIICRPDPKGHWQILKEYKLG